MAIPDITALVPASAALGDPAFTLRVQGTGFTATDVIVWNGSNEPTTFVSATQLTTGVDMSTAEVAMELPVAVRTAIGDLSNTLMFALREAGSEPDLPALEPPEGFTRVTDPRGRPAFVKVEEIVGIEEAVLHTDTSGALYGSATGPYRRITLKGGAQIHLGADSLAPLLTGLRRR